MSALKIKKGANQPLSSLYQTASNFSDVLERDTLGPVPALKTKPGRAGAVSSAVFRPRFITYDSLTVAEVDHTGSP